MNGSKSRIGRNEEMLFRIDERQHQMTQDLRTITQRVGEIEKILEKTLVRWKVKVYSASLGLSLLATIGTTWAWLSLHGRQLVP